jgi:hypothetical protein
MKKQAIIKCIIRAMVLMPVFLLARRAGAQVLPEYSAFPSSSIGLQLGAQGFGVQGSTSFARLFDIRYGFNTVPGISIDYNNRYVKLDRTSIYTIADWQPEFGGSSWFERKWFVSTGVAYYFSNTLYRQGIGTLPNYQIFMSKFRPYLGTGLGNIRLLNNLRLRLDLGEFFPTSAPTSTYENKAEKVTVFPRSLLPGLNAAAGVYLKF